HQQAAVRAAADSQVLRGGDAVADQLLRHGREIVIDALPVLLQSGTMPLRAELATAANTGEDEDAAALEPRGAGIRAVGRRAGDLESAVGAEQGGIIAVALHVAAMHDEERDLGAVRRRRVLLIDD